MTKRPGQDSGRDGGIYQEVGPRGGRRNNFATVPDNRRLPPTSSPGAEWSRIRRTPNSNR